MQIAMRLLELTNHELKLGSFGVFLQLLSSFFIFMNSYSVWLGFQSRSEHMLQCLYLMCKAKHHKSQRRSSVSSNGSLNHSEDEKADTSLFLGAEWKLSGFRFFWLSAHLSSREFCSKTAGKGDIWLLSVIVQSPPSFRRPVFGCTQSPVYILMTNTFIPVWWWFTDLRLQNILNAKGSTSFHRKHLIKIIVDKKKTYYQCN